MGYEVWNVTDTFDDANQTLSRFYEKGKIVDGFVTVSFASFEAHRLDFEVWVRANTNIYGV
jgi:hypothetical protein